MRLANRSYQKDSLIFSFVYFTRSAVSAGGYQRTNMELFLREDDQYGYKAKKVFSDNQGKRGGAGRNMCLFHLTSSGKVSKIKE